MNPKFGGPYTTIIQSCNLDNISYNTSVFNIANFSDVICVKLPNDLPRTGTLIEIYNLDNNKIIEFEDYVYQLPHRPWVDIKQALLDTSIGQHTYRLKFSLPDTYLEASCWFSYIIQDNYPETPYIYMDRNEGDDGDDGSDDSSGGNI